VGVAKNEEPDASSPGLSFEIVKVDLVARALPQKRTFHDRPPA